MNPSLPAEARRAKAGESAGGSYFQFLFAVELKKRYYLKQLEGRKHMVEEVYLVEWENAWDKPETKELTCA
ncbi:hypothetical protein COY07_01460 [Candidatus Peregrinibacteria bacterium CG_4_10_14_0_2_um_filter_43_11]|nr:MAG: hypothetical protein COY07_01460 [Candidatus Peregrinibacteria bacterium CG_4_10_14_0_2_um_filter_43_11]